MRASPNYLVAFLCGIFVGACFIAHIFNPCKNTYSREPSIARHAPDMPQIKATAPEKTHAGLHSENTPLKPITKPWTSRKCYTCRNKDEIKFSSQYKQDEDIWKTFYNNACICNGTYVEIGALDGIWLSNTNFYHNYLNWKGVLIEAVPDVAKKLKKNRPNDFTYGYAICPKGQQNTTFAVRSSSDISHLARKKGVDTSDKKHVTVPCFPTGMGGILHDAGIQAVDLFCLDVEGSEMFVLESMDWSIPVGMFMIEMNIQRPEMDKPKRDLLEKMGYISKGKIGGRDEMFMHPDYLKHMMHFN